MLLRIVVAFDGSDLAREAFAYSAQLCQATGAGILALHILEPTIDQVLAANPAMGLDPMAASVAPPAELTGGDAAARARAEKDFADMGSYCRGVGVEFVARIEAGIVLECLSEEARPGDLLAVGMKGRFRRSGVGSSTRALVQRAPAPVMVVGGPLRPINRILAVHDLTEVSTRAVTFARSLAQQARWPLTILACSRHVGELDRSIAEATRLCPDAQVIASGAPAALEADLIMHTAQKDRFALLIMGAYAESWFHDLLLGSTTAQVLSRLGGPAILVH